MGDQSLCGGRGQEGSDVDGFKRRAGGHQLVVRSEANRRAFPIRPLFSRAETLAE